MKLENQENDKNLRVPDSCPHCGNKLSPWQQVLLNVDKILTCKNCWYKIIYDPLPDSDEPLNEDDSNKKNGK